MACHPGTAEIGEVDNVGPLIEVRLLGALAVRRPDGTVVAAKEWRTAKTRDLLRILALHAGRAVPSDQLTDALWPDVSPEKARTSLRVAVLQVRRVLGDGAVDREFDGLVLRGAWVDLDAFTGLVDEARRHFVAGELLEGLRVAEEAAALHTGELCADVPYADWALPFRARTVLLHQSLLSDAAEAALTLGWLRAAVELAELAVVQDPCAERCYRVLMRGYHRLGETAAALRAFERCRTGLAEELGSDPAPETDALHRELLTSDPLEELDLPLVGRDAELAAGRQRLSAAMSERRRTAVVITGLPGAGAGRMAEALVEPWGSEVVSLRCGADEAAVPLGFAERLTTALLDRTGPARAPRGLAQALTGAAPLVVVLHDLHLADEASRDALAGAWATVDGAVALITTMVRRPGAPGTTSLFPDRHEIDLQPLDDQAVTELVTRICQGTPTAALVEHISIMTGRLAGRVVSTTRSLVAGGQVRPAPGGGVELSLRAVSGGPSTGGIDRLLARARTLVAAPGLDVLDLLAVARAALPFSVLVELLPEHPRGQLHAAATQLEDLTVLSQARDAFSFRHPAVAQHAYQWLRPSRRNHLHTQLAQRQELPPADRAEHWVATGRPSRAVPLLLHAAVFARDAGAPSAARLLLVRARDLSADLPANARRDLDILEALGDVWLVLGRHQEAVATWEQAITVAREHHPDVVARLHRRCGEAEAAARTADGGLAHYTSAIAALSETDVAEHAAVSVGLAGALALEQPQAAARWVTNALVLADDAGAPAQRIDARVAAAWHVLGPRRQLAAAHEALDEAVAIAREVGDVPRMERALLVEGTIAALLGDGARHLHRFERLGLEAVDPSVRGAALLLQGLVLHEQGSPLFATRWAGSGALNAGGHRGEVRRQLAALIAVDRSRHQRAARLLAVPEAALWGPLSTFVAITRARLAEQHGDPHKAIEILSGALQAAEQREEQLLTGELLTRLAALGFATGRPQARDWLQQASAALGGDSFPREQTLLLLAKAESLAADPTASADLATAATFVATNAGLVHIAIHALRARARHEAAGGDLHTAGATLDHAADMAAAASAHHLARVLRGERSSRASGLLRHSA